MIRYGTLRTELDVRASRPHSPLTGLRLCSFVLQPFSVVLGRDAFDQRNGLCNTWHRAPALNPIDTANAVSCTRRCRCIRCMLHLWRRKRSDADFRLGCRQSGMCEARTLSGPQCRGACAVDHVVCYSLCTNFPKTIRR